MDISSKPTWEEVAITASRQRDELREEIEYVKANYVTVAEEAQRRHDACAPLTAKLERLRAALARYGRHLVTCSFYKDGEHQRSPETACDCGLVACQTLQ